MKVDFEMIGLEFLDLDYFLYSFSDVKLRNIFSEFTLFQLSKIKDIIDEEAKFFWALLLHIHIILTFIMYGF